MMETSWIMVITGVSLLALLLLCLTLLVSLWLLQRPKRTANVAERSETEMIQEMYHGLDAMERRIETLETLLLETDAGRKAAPTGKDAKE
jgi:phage shock protein B